MRRTDKLPRCTNKQINEHTSNIFESKTYSTANKLRKMEETEAEANAAALKQVAAMLQRPDQLEKLDLYKKKAIRKKVSHEET